MKLRAGELQGRGPKAAPEGGFPEESSASSQQTSSRQRGSKPDPSNRAGAATVSPLRPQAARIESRLRARQKRCYRLPHWLAQGFPRGLTGGTAGRVERGRRLDVDHLRLGGGSPDTRPRCEHRGLASKTVHPGPCVVSKGNLTFGPHGGCCCMTRRSCARTGARRNYAALVESPRTGIAQRVSLRTDESVNRSTPRATSASVAPADVSRQAAPCGRGPSSACCRVATPAHSTRHVGRWG